MVMRKYIRFIGKYPDLKKMGYKFTRMFARNYMCWHKTTDPEGYCKGIWIWKMGNEVEFADLHHLSYLVLEALQNGQDGKYLAINRYYHRWLIHTKEKTIVPFDHNIHHEWQMAIADGVEFENGVPVDKEAWKKWLNGYFDTYRKFDVIPEFVDLIKELVDRHMIEIAEREEKTS